MWQLLRIVLIKQLTSAFHLLILPPYSAMWNVNVITGGETTWDHGWVWEWRTCIENKREPPLRHCYFGFSVIFNQIKYNSKEQMAHFQPLHVVSRSDVWKYCSHCTTMKETNLRPKWNIKIADDKIELQSQPTLQPPSCGFFFLCEKIYFIIP